MAKRKGGGGRKPAPPGTEAKTYRMPPAARAQIARVRAYYSLTTDTAAVLYALGVADRAIPPDFKPLEQ